LRLGNTLDGTVSLTKKVVSANFWHLSAMTKPLKTRQPFFAEALRRTSK
jgi:hypothetical protein